MQRADMRLVGEPGDGWGCSLDIPDHDKKGRGWRFLNTTLAPRFRWKLQLLALANDRELATWTSFPQPHKAFHFAIYFECDIQ